MRVVLIGARGGLSGMLEAIRDEAYQGSYCRDRSGDMTHRTSGKPEDSCPCNGVGLIAAVDNSPQKRDSRN
jgi:hypothetical protein